MSSTKNSELHLQKFDVDSHKVFPKSHSSIVFCVKKKMCNHFSQIKLSALGPMILLPSWMALGVVIFCEKIFHKIFVNPFIIPITIFRCQQEGMDHNLHLITTIMEEVNLVK